MKGNMIGNLGDAIFQMFLHMQSWRVLIRPSDRPLLDEALEKVRRLHARTTSTS
jgi:hypothetical protein